MFLADSFRDTGKPLLSVLAEPNSIFIQGLRLFKNKSVYANTINDRSVPYYTACISRVDPFVDLDAIDIHYQPGQEPDKQVILDPSNPVTPRQSPEETRSLFERITSVPQRTLNDLPFYAAITVLLPIGATFFLLNSGVQTYRSAQRVRLHEEGHSGFSIGRYRIPLLESAQAVQDRVYESLSQQNEQFLPTPPPEPATEPGSSGASSTTAAGEGKELARQETEKEGTDFPILALTPEQFAMIDNLNDVGLTKYPVHIQNVRHTHAAIVVRSERASFWEGRVVTGHWATRFEL